MDTNHLSRLAGQVKRYIEKVLPQLERAGGFPDSPMDRKSKGTSNPPVGDRALLLWWVNRDASRILNPLLREVNHGDEYYGPYAFSDLLEFATYDSGAFVRWLTESATRQYAAWSMYMQIATVVMVRHPDLELPKDRQWVITSPREASLHGAGDYDEVGDPRKVAPRWRTITANDAYYSIVARLERIRMTYPGITEAAAEVECQKELEALHGNSVASSIGRIRDAKGFVNKERTKPGARTNGGTAA